MAPDGNFASFDGEDISIAAGWHGDSADFIDACVTLRLLDSNEGVLYIHEWMDYQGSWCNAQRQKKYRENKNPLRNGDATVDDSSATVEKCSVREERRGEEKRREETRGDEQTGDEEDKKIIQNGNGQMVDPRTILTEAILFDCLHNKGYGQPNPKQTSAVVKLWPISTEEFNRALEAAGNGKANPNIWGVINHVEKSRKPLNPYQQADALSDTWTPEMEDGYGKE
jgi:hypothetical protein